jgi:uncharacterized protein YjbJ (UPF0337 family)
MLGVILTVNLAACGNLTRDGKRDETKGKVEQVGGDITGDSALKANSRKDKTKGHVEKAAGKVKDAVTNP